MKNEENPATWYEAKPEELPKPTYSPFFLALGIIFLLWGIPTSVYVTLLGALIGLIALIRWINLLRHE